MTKQAMQTILKRIRIKRGMSRAELAEKAGVTPQTIRNIESGNRNPTFGAVVAICDALNAKIEITE